MKKCPSAVICALFFLTSLYCLGGTVWEPALAGKKNLTAANTPGVVSGETLLKDEDGGPVMTFQASREPASFKAEGILNQKQGSLELSFRPDFKMGSKAFQCNHLFVSGKYLLGYNIGEKEHALYLLAKTKDGKSAGAYAKTTLAPDKWHTVRAEWQHGEISLYLDGKLLTRGNQGDLPFGKTFRLGASGWPLSRCLMRGVKIVSGDFKQIPPPAAAAPKKSN